MHLWVGLGSFNLGGQLVVAQKVGRVGIDATAVHQGAAGADDSHPIGYDVPGIAARAASGAEHLGGCRAVGYSLQLQRAIQQATTQPSDDGIELARVHQQGSVEQARGQVGVFH